MSDIYRQIIDRLSTCKRVLVTTHVRPDGDAIGTTAALVLAMRKVGIDAEVLLLSHLPTKYNFVYKELGIVHTDVENGWPGEQGQGARGKGQGTDDASALAPRPSPLAPFFSRFDALLVADTGTWSQLPGLKERLANWNVPKIVLDHHLTQENWADLKLVVTEAAAAGEIAAELIEQWEIEIDSAIATALYVAIASDTGWFQFSNTRPFTHRLAATLIEKGVDTDRIYQMLYQNERAERVALQTRAMQTLELLAEGRLAIMKIGKDDFKATNARVPDTENLINVPLQIRTVQVVALITDPPEGGPIRVSLRSKGQLDCAKFAEQFGGGGHARAAGMKLEGDFPSVAARITQALLTALPT